MFFWCFLGRSFLIKNLSGNTFKNFSYFFFGNWRFVLSCVIRLKKFSLLLGNFDLVMLFWPSLKLWVKGWVIIVAHPQKFNVTSMNIFKLNADQFYLHPIQHFEVAKKVSLPLKKSASYFKKKYQMIRIHLDTFDIWKLYPLMCLACIQMY